MDGGKKQSRVEEETPMVSKKSANEADDAFIGEEQDWTNLLGGG